MAADFNIPTNHSSLLIYSPLSSFLSFSLSFPFSLLTLQKYILSLHPLLNLHPILSFLPSVALIRSYWFSLRVVHVLVPVTQPTHSSRNGPQNREHVGWKAHCFVDYATVEIHIRVKLSFGKVRIIENDFLQIKSYLNKALFSCHFKHILSNTLDNFCTGIIVLIHRMTKSIQLFLIVLDILNKLMNIPAFLYLLQHV